jgi:serine phosphatase RsbU (regulator of sigma subunit)
MSENGDKVEFVDLLGQSVRAHAWCQRFQPGDVIVREGEAGSSAFILLSGSCEVTVQDDVLGVVSPGDLFGDIACLEGGTRTATIRATSPSDVLEIAGHALRVELRRSPALLDRFLRLVAQRVRDISRRETAVRSEHHDLRRVLQDLQPKLDRFKTIPYLSMEVRCEPLSFASGDYYDVLELSSNRVLFAIGDVMGHGASTTPIYAMVRSQLHEFASAKRRPHELLAHIHQHLRQHGHPNVFMTLTLLMLDVDSRTADFAVGGPPCPLVYSGGSCRPLTHRLGWTLGYPFEGIAFESETMPLTQGDTFLFYTDGLSDVARGPDREREVLGVAGLSAIFSDLCATNSNGIADGVFDGVQGFRGSWPVEDDATALIVRVR